MFSIYGNILLHNSTYLPSAYWLTERIALSAFQTPPRSVRLLHRTDAFSARLLHAVRPAGRIRRGQRQELGVDTAGKEGSPGWELAAPDSKKGSKKWDSLGGNWFVWAK